MRRFRLVVLLCLILGQGATGFLQACPMCQEAIPNSSSVEDEDQARLARAYNRSIYLMVGMPYLLVGAVGYLVYRQVRLRAVLEVPTESVARPISPGDDHLSLPPGDRTCSQPFIDGIS